MFNILAIGDITGSGGLRLLASRLQTLRRDHNAVFAVVNGENAAGRGLTRADAKAIFAAGADVVTLGNHAFSKREIMPYLDDERRIVRPANFAPVAPGHGEVTERTEYGDIRVITLIGRRGMDYNVDSPFYTIRRILSDHPCKYTLIDFHAEATAEKQAMAHMLDGTVSAIWGTHTHVQTADAQILPHGTGYITDLGMTGPAVSVIGMDIQQSVNMFLGVPKEHYESAAGACRLEGAVFSLDTETGLCVGVAPIRIDE